MCASKLSKKTSVGIIDVNAKVAAKLKISGGGKCNITNVSVTKENFDGDSDLISSVLDDFSKEDLLDFFEKKLSNSSYKKKSLLLL